MYLEHSGPVEDEQKRIFQKPALNEGVLVRNDGTVVTADEWYYDFVQTSSGLSLCELIAPEDGEHLRGQLEDLAKQRDYDRWEPGTLLGEYLTRLENRLGDVVEHAYLRLESTRETEGRRPLFRIIVSDLQRMQTLEAFRRQLLSKYRFFMTLKNEMYFEYRPSDEHFVVYKYINGNSFRIEDTDIFEYLRRVHEPMAEKDPNYAQGIRTFLSYLKKEEPSFEMNVRYQPEDGEAMTARIVGGVPAGVPDMVAGIYIPSQEFKNEAYYLTPAAKDPGTGLLNKRAVTEYAMEMLPTIEEGEIAWLLIIDIDDFKSINDNFGHAFGDEVIKYVADTLQKEVGTRGFAGRFGGDEFFVFRNRIRTRDDLKLLLKTVTKQFLIKFDTRFVLTCSVGVSCYPQDGATLEELFAKADKALYIAKEKGKNRHIIYDPKLHGDLESESIQSQAVSYAISAERRREVLGRIMLGMCEQGAAYFVESRDHLRDLRTIFDLDGITIVTDFGGKVLCRDGKYVTKPNLDLLVSECETVFTRKENSGKYVENNILMQKDVHPELYQGLYVQQEIGACIVCAEFVGALPHTMMTFDIFNKTRKWSDKDMDMLCLIGQTITKLLCKQ